MKNLFWIKFLEKLLYFECHNMKLCGNFEVLEEGDFRERLGKYA